MSFMHFGKFCKHLLTQHTPKPLAQLPSLEPPLAEHSSLKYNEYTYYTTVFSIYSIVYFQQHTKCDWKLWIYFSRSAARTLFNFSEFTVYTVPWFHILTKNALFRQSLDFDFGHKWDSKGLQCLTKRCDKLYNFINFFGFYETFWPFL